MENLTIQLSLLYLALTLPQYFFYMGHLVERETDKFPAPDSLCLQGEIRNEDGEKDRGSCGRTRGEKEHYEKAGRKRRGAYCPWGRFWNGPKKGGHNFHLHDIVQILISLPQSSVRGAGNVVTL